MEFNTKYHRKRDELKIFDPQSLVERQGYIPPKVQIENMILAGKRLNDFRMGYEFNSDEIVPDDYMDPTRNPGFDLVDASNLALVANDRLQSSLKKKDEEKKLEYEKKVIEPSVKVDKTE